MSDQRVEQKTSSQSASTGRIGMDGVIRRGPGAPVDMRQPRPAQPLRPQPQPVQRAQAAPMPAQHRRAQPAPLRQAQPMQQPAPAAVAPAKKQRAPKTKRSHNGLKIFFQSVLALVVILGVAVGIVVLYLRYYQ